MRFFVYMLGRPSRKKWCESQEEAERHAQKRANQTLKIFFVRDTLKGGEQPFFPKK